MKKIVYLIAVTFFVFNAFSANAQADKVVGLWLTQEGDSQVKIHKVDDKYFGEIVWLKNPKNEDGTPKVDKENPDDKLKKQPILGLKLLKDFEYDDDDKEWEDGTIYDPNNGSTYSCYMWFDKGDDKTLHVKGFIGFALIGREVEWTRESSLRK